MLHNKVKNTSAHSLIRGNSTFKLHGSAAQDFYLDTRLSPAEGL